MISIVLSSRSLILLSVPSILLLSACSELFILVIVFLNYNIFTFLNICVFIEAFPIVSFVSSSRMFTSVFLSRLPSSLCEIRLTSQVCCVLTVFFPSVWGFLGFGKSGFLLKPGHFFIMLWVSRSHLNLCFNWLFLALLCRGRGSVTDNGGRSPGSPPGLCWHLREGSCPHCWAAGRWESELPTWSPLAHQGVVTTQWGGKSPSPLGCSGDPGRVTLASQGRMRRLPLGLSCTVCNVLSHFSPGL